MSWWVRVAGVELKQQRARQHQQGAVLLLLSSVSTQSPLASMSLIRIFTLRMLNGSCDIVQHKHSKWRLVCRWRRLEQRCWGAAAFSRPTKGPSSAQAKLVIILIFLELYWCFCVCWVILCQPQGPRMSWYRGVVGHFSSLPNTRLTEFSWYFCFKDDTAMSSK